MLMDDDDDVDDDFSDDDDDYFNFHPSWITFHYVKFLWTNIWRNTLNAHHGGANTQPVQYRSPWGQQLWFCQVITKDF